MKDEKGRNYGFVSMATHNDAEKAISDLHESKIGGLKIIYKIIKFFKRRKLIG